MVGLYRNRVPAARTRITVVIIIFVFFFLAIIARLFFIQVIAHEHYQDLADGQQKRIADLAATRGEIYAWDHTNEDNGQLFVLAANKTFYEVFINPTEVTRPVNTAELLSQVLGVDYETILARAKKENDVYEPVTQKATEEQVQKIKLSGLTGIYELEQIGRYYPDKEVGSHILGFYGVDDDRKVGKYGIEGYWQDELAGVDEESIMLRDAQGTVMPGLDSNFNLAIDGSDLVLTIDRSAQFEICRILESNIQKYAADKGTAIVMETETGKILAMCNYPAFDPNEYQLATSISDFNNDAVFDAYEPGSVFKPIAMAIAIDQGKVTPTTVYEDVGEVTIGGETIRNFDKKAHGTKTMTEVLQESLNLGIIFATQDVPNKLYYEYIKKFGFGEKTNIELSQEVSGNLGQLKTAKDIYKATSSFGQGLTVTPLQMLAAVNVIANGGVLIRPYIVDEIRRSDGQVVTTQPMEIRRVISDETADTVTAMMVRVVEEGYDHKAQVPGYYMAGKTGTGQIVENKEYGDKTNHTFVGFGPANNSKFSILIRLNNVKNVGFASDSTTLIFNEIARFLLQYYKIPPDH